MSHLQAIFLNKNTKSVKGFQHSKSLVMKMLFLKCALNIQNVKVFEKHFEC